MESLYKNKNSLFNLKKKLRIKIIHYLIII